MCRKANLINSLLKDYKFFKLDQNNAKDIFFLNKSK